MAKKIADSWAKKELLLDVELLLLLFLGDPLLQKIDGIQKLLDYVSMGRLNQQIKRYSLQLGNVRLGFLLDGFDEYPSSLHEKSFIASIIKGEKFPNSKIIITSRPTVAMSQHYHFDRRVEILGFAEEAQEEYISQLFNAEKKEELKHYLENTPSINSLCFIPINLAIILYLFQQDDLPKTQTEMYESFIIHAIRRSLSRATQPCANFDSVKKVEKLPQPVLYTVKKLSQLHLKVS